MAIPIVFVCGGMHSHTQKSAHIFETKQIKMCARIFDRDNSARLPEGFYSNFYIARFDILFIIHDAPLRLLLFLVSFSGLLFHV